MPTSMLAILSLLAVLLFINDCNTAFNDITNALVIQLVFSTPTENYIP